MNKILLVEDEPSLLDALTLNLELEGYSITIAEDGKKALALFNDKSFDLIILDVMIPEIDGFEVCQTIRLTDTNLPILFLTARNAQEDKIKGLKYGGDDYLVKPFNLEEFLLRVNNLIKRKNTTSLSAYHFNGNDIDFNSFQAKNHLGEERKLTEKEAKLLKLLITKKGDVISRKEILEVVWGYDTFPSTRTIDNFILAFRKFFEQDSKNPIHFLSIRGVGYKFEG